MNRISMSEGLAISQIIVNLLQRDSELEEALDEYDSNIYIDAMQNGREQGFSYWTVNPKTGKYFTWCTYEHRNSDAIIVNGKEGLLHASGELPYAGNKWQCIGEFNYGEYQKAANFLAKQIIGFVSQEAEDSE